MIGAPVLECIFDTARHPKRPVYNPDPATQVGLGGRVSSAVWARDNELLRRQTGVDDFEF